MGCIVEFNGVRFNFIQNKLKQKTWIEALLCFTHLDINSIAEFLEVFVEMLDTVSGNNVVLLPITYKIAQQEAGAKFPLCFTSCDSIKNFVPPGILLTNVVTRSSSRFSRANRDHSNAVFVPSSE